MADSTQMIQIIEEVQEKLFELISDKFGNFVVQRVLQQLKHDGNNDLQLCLVEKIQQLTSQSNKEGYIKHVHDYLIKEGPNDNTFLSDLLNKYESSIKPSFEKFVEPTKKYADIILPNYGFTTDDNLDIDKMNIPANAVDLIIKRLLPD